MPNVGSWNGQWSGRGNKYFKVCSYIRDSRNRILELMNGETRKSFYYNFGDGWGALITMEIIDAKEGRKRNKISNGFCGYEWMIDSIIKTGRIMSNYDKNAQECDATKVK